MGKSFLLIKVGGQVIIFNTLWADTVSYEKNKTETTHIKYKPEVFIIRFNQQNDIPINNSKHNIGKKKKLQNLQG